MLDKRRITIDALLYVGPCGISYNARGGCERFIILSLAYLVKVEFPP